jgi:hypothetical protein
MAGFSLALDSLKIGRLRGPLIADLAPAVVNSKVLCFNTYLWFSRYQGSPGGAAGKRHFIHIMYISMQTTESDDDSVLTSYSGVPGGKTMGPMTSERFCAPQRLSTSANAKGKAVPGEVRWHISPLLLDRSASTCLAHGYCAVSARRQQNVVLNTW